MKSTKKNHINIKNVKMKKQKKYFTFHLPTCFQLLNRDLFALTLENGQAQILWNIKETVKNGNYVRYELEARGEYISDQAATLFSGYAKGLLTAGINFHPYTGKTRVFLQDFWVIPQGKGLGTLMLDLFIQFLHEWNSFFEIESIRGELSVIDEEVEENKNRRDYLYQKAGFTILRNENTRKKYIQASVRNLKRLPSRQTFLLPPEKVFYLIKNGLTCCDRAKNFTL